MRKAITKVSKMAHIELDQSGKPILVTQGNKGDVAQLLYERFGIGAVIQIDFCHIDSEHAQKGDHVHYRLNILPAIIAAANEAHGSDLWNTENMNEKLTRMFLGLEGTNTPTPSKSTFGKIRMQKFNSYCEVFAMDFFNLIIQRHKVSAPFPDER